MKRETFLPKDLVSMANAYIDAGELSYFNQNSIDIEWDQSLYHILPFKYLYAQLKNGKVCFKQPDSWSDPFEGALCKTIFNQKISEDITIQHVFSPLKSDISAQCWSLRQESWALWGEIKSQSCRNCPVQIKTTAGKLLLEYKKKLERDASVYLGRIRYYPEKEFKEELGKIVRQFRSSPSQKKLLILSFLMKRDAFDYEHEVRLIRLGPSTSKGEKILVSCNLKDVIDQIVVHPSCTDKTMRMIERMLRNVGYTAEVTKSPLLNSLQSLDIPYEDESSKTITPPTLTTSKDPQKATSTDTAFQSAWADSWGLDGTIYDNLIIHS